MPFCPDGSAQNAGVGRYISIGAAALGALLTKNVSKGSIFAAGLLGGLTFDLQTMCDADPPADPGMTAADWLELTNAFDPIRSGAAQDKFRQLVNRLVWFEFCHCITGPTVLPTIPYPTDSPATTTITTPVAPCASFDSGYVSGPGYGSGSRNYQLIGSDHATPATDVALPIPPNATSVRLTGFRQAAGAVHGLVVVSIKWYYTSNSSGTFALQSVSTINTTGTQSSTANLPIPSGSLGPYTNWTVVGQCVIDNPTDQIRATAEWYCNGDLPGGYDAPCCPPDPIVESTLQTILEYVRLIQRQIAPFAFIDGPSNSVTGTGTVTVTNPLVGVRVDLVDVPGRAGLISGTPDELFDIGYVSLGDDDGWFGSQRLGKASQLWQPRWAGAVTKIGYSLTPGVSATITQLEREP